MLGLAADGRVAGVAKETGVSEFRAVGWCVCHKGDYNTPNGPLQIVSGFLFSWR